MIKCPDCGKLVSERFPMHECKAESLKAWRTRNVDMETGTHTGKRLKWRGQCEKCGTPTNWVVDIDGRVGAFWCGCGNSEPDAKESHRGHGIDKPHKTND